MQNIYKISNFNSLENCIRTNPKKIIVILFNNDVKTINETTSKTNDNYINYVAKQKLKELSDNPDNGNCLFIHVNINKFSGKLPKLVKKITILNLYEYVHFKIK